MDSFVYLDVFLRFAFQRTCQSIEMLEMKKGKLRNVISSVVSSIAKKKLAQNSSISYELVQQEEITKEEILVMKIKNELNILLYFIIFFLMFFITFITNTGILRPFYSEERPILGKLFFIVCLFFGRYTLVWRRKSLLTTSLEKNFCLKKVFVLSLVLGSVRKSEPILWLCECYLWNHLCELCLIEKNCILWFCKTWNFIVILLVKNTLKFLSKSKFLVFMREGYLFSNFW